MYYKHHHMTDMTAMPNGGVGGDPLRDARVRRSSQLGSSASSTCSRSSISSGGSKGVRRLGETTRESVRSAARTVDKLTTIRISSSSPSPAKDDREHRSRLLNRLGIYGRIAHSKEHTNTGTCAGTSSSSQRRPSDCSTASLLSYASSLATTADSSSLRRSTSNESGDDTLITQLPASAPTCSGYRIADVPRDPATVRKMNMLRSLGVGGIRSSVDHLPRTAVPVCFDSSSSSDRGAIGVIRGASRPQIADIPPLVEPLKYEKEAEEGEQDEKEEKEEQPAERRRRSDPPPPSLKKMLDQLSLSSTCSTSASSLPSSCEDKTQPRSTSKSTKNNNNKKRSIRFAPSVSVVQIPMRSEYSSRIATRLWSSRTEIRDNANRNVVEFSAEDWDWRAVVEDDGMFVCTASGELVHPVHCQDCVPAHNNSQQQQEQQPKPHQHQTTIDTSDSTDDVWEFTLD